MEMKDTLSSCSNSESQQMQQIQDQAKKSFMISFRQLHSHLKRFSQNDLQGSRTESGFKRTFATLSCHDTETFTGAMNLNVEQLEKQLDKEDFQEIGSMAAFNVLETQFQMFITNRDYLDDEYVAMTHIYFIQYTGQTIPEFCDTLIQHLESVKKSINERVQLKREYDSWVNKRQMQTTEEKVDTSKALDASLVDTESNAPIKGRSDNEGEAAAKRISNDLEEIARVLSSMDAVTVLAGETNVPTGSGFIPTAGPPATVISTGSEVGPTASPIVKRRKRKEVMVESDTPKKKKLQEQIDAQVARELEEQQE
nr:hypothetical protein [Tanacetum cinerariifolium]